MTTMKLTTLLLALAAIFFASMFNATTTSAQPTRVFVAAQGSDNNACTFAAPCRSFQKAHDTVAAGGEIIPLDDAGYGTVSITKSVSISTPSGIYAGITAASGNGITVNDSGIN